MNNERLTSREKLLAEAGNFLWVVLASVSGGDWTKQHADWQRAAEKARDDFHNVLKDLNDLQVTQEWIEAQARAQTIQKFHQRFQRPEGPDINLPVMPPK